MRHLMILVVVVVVAACGSSTSTATSGAPAATSPATTPATTLITEPPTTEPAPATSTSANVSVQACADVVDASAQQLDDGTWTVSATVRSGDTGWEKYADLWEISVDGETIGERVLAHPHETEQPFTRSVSGIAIPDGATDIELTARDSVNGFCGEVFVLTLN